MLGGGFLLLIFIFLLIRSQKADQSGSNAQNLHNHLDNYRDDEAEGFKQKSREKRRGNEIVDDDSSDEEELP